MLIATNVDFLKSWNTLWSKLSVPSTVTTWLGILGAAFVVFAAVRYILDRRKGQRGNHMTLIFTVIVGLLLINPQTFVGYLLSIIDAISNIVVHAFGG